MQRAALLSSPLNTIMFLSRYLWRSLQQANTIHGMPSRIKKDRFSEAAGIKCDLFCFVTSTVFFYHDEKSRLLLAAYKYPQMAGCLAG